MYNVNMLQTAMNNNQITSSEVIFRAQKAAKAAERAIQAAEKAAENARVLKYLCEEGVEVKCWMSNIQQYQDNQYARVEGSVLTVQQRNEDDQLWYAPKGYTWKMTEELMSESSWGHGSESHCYWDQKWSETYKLVKI